MGISGNTTRDLKLRWKTDVLDLKPDWLSIFIGINDIWRQFDAPLALEKQVPLKEYEKNLNELINLTKKNLKSLKGLMLISPYYIEANPSDEMRVMTQAYSAVVKALAKKYGAIFVDAQFAFDRVLASIYSGAIAWDRIHPLPVGHAVLARAVLQAIDFDFNKK
jgi:lysophospholipase L1-like esterase